MAKFDFTAAAKTKLQAHGMNKDGSGPIEPMSSKGAAALADWRKKHKKKGHHGK